MGRREYMVGLGVAAAVWPFAVRAQQPSKVRRIGATFAGNVSDPQAPANLTAFTETFRVLGWEEGRNVQVEYRWGGGDPEKIGRFDRELVGLKLEAIVGITTRVAGALQQRPTPYL